MLITVINGITDFILIKLRPSFTVGIFAEELYA